jgi:hypothetical protein
MPRILKRIMHWISWTSRKKQPVGVIKQHIMDIYHLMQVFTSIIRCCSSIVHFSLCSTSIHTLITSSVPTRSLYKMANSYFEGFIHILCNIFFKATFLNLVLKLHTKCQWYLIGSRKICAMKFLIATCLYDIMHNLVQPPITYWRSKSKKQL